MSRVEHGLDGPDHIARRETAAVVETNAIAQMKNKREGVGLFPLLGQCGGELKACVVGYQAIEEQSIDPFRLSVSADARIEVGWTALDKKDHRVWVPGR